MPGRTNDVLPKQFATYRLMYPRLIRTPASNTPKDKLIQMTETDTRRHQPTLPSHEPATYSAAACRAPSAVNVCKTWKPSKSGGPR